MRKEMSNERLHELIELALYCTLEKCSDYAGISTICDNGRAAIHLKDRKRYAAATIEDTGKMVLFWLTKDSKEEITDIGNREFDDYVDAHYVSHVLLRKWEEIK